MNEVNNEHETIGCPSLGMPKLPGGFDGVEPLNRTDYEAFISDVFHRCNEAFINAPNRREVRPAYFKLIVGDIADALASVVPCERSARGESPAEDEIYKTPDAEMDVVLDNLTPDMIERICERYGLKKRMTRKEYMTVAPGVELKQFKGTKSTRLVAVRKGHEGNADTLFEISVDRETDCAVIERDGEIIYRITTVGLSDLRLTNAAINVLRSHLHENKRVYIKNREARRIRAGILTPEQEVAATVARQNDDDELAERIENA